VYLSEYAPYLGNRALNSGNFTAYSGSRTPQLSNYNPYSGKYALHSGEYTSHSQGEMICQ
jgi:hypothetical protein